MPNILLDLFGPISIGTIRLVLVAVVLYGFLLRIMHNNISSTWTDNAQTPLTLIELAVLVFFFVADKFDWGTILGFSAIVALAVLGYVMWRYTHRNATPQTAPSEPSA